MGQESEEKYITHKQALTYLFSVIGFIVTVAIAGITSHNSLSQRVSVNEANRSNDQKKDIEMSVKFDLISAQIQEMNNRQIEQNAIQKLKWEMLEENLKNRR